MNSNIRKLLLELLRQNVIVGSWGMTNVSIKQDTINFDVQGMLYQGAVSISPQKGIYHIELDGVAVSVPLESVVQKLDVLVESGEGYIHKLQSWLSSGNLRK